MDIQTACEDKDGEIISSETAALPFGDDAMKRNAFLTASVVKYSMTPRHEKKVH